VVQRLFGLKLSKRKVNH